MEQDCNINTARIIGAEPGDGFEDVFSSCDDLSYLELINCEDSTRSTIRQGTSNGDEFPIWLEGQMVYEAFEHTLETFRVIFSKGHATCSRCSHSNSPLRMTSRTFHCMAREFHVPYSYIQMIRQGCTVFVDTQEESQDGVSTFIVQNAFTTTSRFSVAVSYEPQRCITSAFIHGLSGSEVDDMTAKIIANRDLLGLPVLPLYLLLALRGASAMNKIRECQRQIVEIEYQTGISATWHPNKSCCYLRQAREFPIKHDMNIDFDRVTRGLTSLTSSLAFCEYLGEIHLPMLDKLHEISRRAITAASQQHQKRLEEQDHCLRMYTSLLRSSLIWSHCRARYLSKRSQAQVQNIYSLIAQKDNAISMRDNAALKTISEDQKRIALAATRDSAAMRVIAAITAIFLPATFTATLFSTTFFNFQVGNQGQVVSWWLWLYFVVTVVLSSLIVACWHFSLRRKIHEIDNTFGSKDEKSAS